MPTTNKALKYIYIYIYNILKPKKLESCESQDQGIGYFKTIKAKGY
jgi:hypothetical protein